MKLTKKEIIKYIKSHESIAEEYKKMLNDLISKEKGFPYPSKKKR